jgi:hypothetical protein
MDWPTPLTLIPTPHKHTRFRIQITNKASHKKINPKQKKNQNRKKDTKNIPDLDLCQSPDNVVRVRVGNRRLEAGERKWVWVWAPVEVRDMHG